MSEQQSGSTRRDFLKTTTAAAVGSGLAGWSVDPRRARAGQRRDPHRPDRLLAAAAAAPCADVFKGHETGVRLVARRRHVRRPHATGRCKRSVAEQYGSTRGTSTPGHVFTGFDAYQKVIDVPEVNYVILATPPGFRPMHLEAAIARRQAHLHREAGGRRWPGHPQGDGARQGSRRQGPEHRRRHAAAAPARLHRDDEAHPRRRHRRRRRHARATGTRASSGSAIASRSGPTWSGRCATGCYFTWLCGDHIVEQHIHNIDVINWVKQGPPGQGDRHGRAAGAHRQGVRPHLRPLRDRLRVPGRLALAEHVPADRQLRQQRLGGASSAPRAARSWTSTRSRAQRRGRARRIRSARTCRSTST